MSGSTQKCRISFYHPLSCVVVIQALPSASPVKCAVPGSVLVLHFHPIFSSLPSSGSLDVSFPAVSKAHSLVQGGQCLFFTDTGNLCLFCSLSHLLGFCSFFLLSLLSWCCWIVCPCPFYSLPWLLMEAESLRRLCCWLDRSSFTPPSLSSSLWRVSLKLFHQVTL